MGQDEWFDEDADEFEYPSEKKGKKHRKRHRPEEDDWTEDDDWGEYSDSD